MYEIFYGIIKLMDPQPKQPPTPPQERKKVYSPEEIKKVEGEILALRLKFKQTSLENYQQLEEEIRLFTKYLTDKYQHNVSKYAMWHAFGGSTISPDREAKILFSDFPDNDSVQKFVESLMKTYNK